MGQRRDVQRCGPSSSHPGVLYWCHAYTLLEHAVKVPLAQASGPRHVAQTHAATRPTDVVAALIHKLPDLVDGRLLWHETFGVRLASLARPEASVACFVDAVVKGHIGASSEPCLTNGPTVDLGGSDAVDKGAICAEVA